MKLISRKNLRYFLQFLAYYSDGRTGVFPENCQCATTKIQSCHSRHQVNISLGKKKLEYIFNTAEYNSVFHLYPKKMCPSETSSTNVR